MPTPQSPDPSNPETSGTRSLVGAGLLAAFAASLCCIMPILAVLGGIGGVASTFSWLEPFRPYLIVLTAGVLTASTSFSEGRALVTFDQREVRADQLAIAVTKETGYVVTKVELVPQP